MVTKIWIKSREIHLKKHWNLKQIRLYWVLSIKSKVKSIIQNGFFSTINQLVQWFSTFFSCQHNLYFWTGVNLMIEGGYIEYGNIEKCNMDTKITSKILRRLTSNKNDGNVENSIENGKIETVTSNLASTYLTSTVKTGSNGVPLGVKRGHSIPYHHQQGAPPPPTPRGPRLTPFYCRC